MKLLKKVIRKIPFLSSIFAFLFNLKKDKFPGSEKYWENRYKSGGNSGSGSYNILAEFKATIINDFIKENNINSAIEFGCGDGNNLSLISYPNYIGLDVSPTAIEICMNKFKNDYSKSFYIYNSLAFLDNHNIFVNELSVSLDVIYHLVEDNIFESYMTHLFKCAQKYVIIYSMDYSEKQISWVKCRQFSEWVAKNQEEFKLIKRIKNPYKWDPKNPVNTSSADFFIYERSN